MRGGSAAPDGSQGTPGPSRCSRGRGEGVPGITARDSESRAYFLLHHSSASRQSWQLHFAPRARPSPIPHSTIPWRNRLQPHHPSCGFRVLTGPRVPTPPQPHPELPRKALESAPELQPAPCRHLLLSTQVRRGTRSWRLRVLGCWAHGPGAGGGAHPPALARAEMRSAHSCKSQGGP